MRIGAATEGHGGVAECITPACKGLELRIIPKMMVTVQSKGCCAHQSD